MKKLIGILSLSFVILTACKKDKDEPTPPSAPPPAPTTHYGDDTNIGDGTGKTFVTLTHTGVPVEVGVVLTAEAFNNLPASGQMYSMPYPGSAAVSGYTHALLGWNPMGHPPGAYSAPHFDFHFYRGMTEAERMMITSGNTQQFMNLPDSIFRPGDYLNDAYGIPMMGLHWIDELAPEFNGGQFTKTFIYGSYDGKFVFYEPMITIAHFLTFPDEKIVIRQPAKVQETGYYPSHYNIRYSAQTNEYTVSIDLVRVQQ